MVSKTLRRSVPGASLSSTNNIDAILANLPFIHRETAKAGERVASNAITEAFDLEGPGWTPNAPSTLQTKGLERPILVGRRHDGAHNRDARITEILDVTPLGAVVGHGWDDSQHPDAAPGKSRAYIQAIQEFGAGVPQREVLGPILEGPHATEAMTAMATAWNAGIGLALAAPGRLRGRRIPGEEAIAASFREVIT